MEQIRQRHQFVVVGYVVMPEHVHLLFTEPERGNPSLVMAALKQTFAQRLLRELRAKTGAQTDSLWSTPFAVGHIWQRRFLRFRCFCREEAGGKAALHASQSRSAGFSSEARGVVMEQLPTLRLWRTRPGSSQRDPKSGASNPQNLLIPSVSQPTRETATGGASSSW